MRIGIIGPSGEDRRAENLVFCLNEMGYEGIHLGSLSPLEGSTSKQVASDFLTKSLVVERAAQRRVVRRAKEFAPEVVLSIDKRLLPETVAALKKYSDRVCLWYFDALTNMGRSLMFVSSFDMIFVKERWLLDRCRSLLDVPMHYLPEGFNPAWTLPLSSDPPGAEMVMAGTMYPFRVRLLERLIKEDLPIRIYGPPLPRWIASPAIEARHTGRYLAGRERAHVYRGSGCVLNTFHPSEIFGVNERFFQTAGAGAALLTEARADVASHFSDEEVVSYSSFEELVEAARYLLDNPVVARRIGDAAAKRAHAEHTYHRRMEAVVEATLASSV